MATDYPTLSDLAMFARLEVGTRDVEPWADLLLALSKREILDEEELLWLIVLYNSYDDLGSALKVFRRWSTPEIWSLSGDREESAEYPIAQERRGLRGGRMMKRHNSYLDQLDGEDQMTWLRQAGEDHAAIIKHLQTVWGVGRQSAFEWAEFNHKVLGIGPEAPQALLWESSGPRRSLQKMYGESEPSKQWLEDRASECREWLALEGVELSWEDFETIICDFNVMRDGRYYPGQHLAMLREELDTQPADQLTLALELCWDEVVPAPWNRIEPGVRKDYRVQYRDHGIIRSEP